MIAPRVIGKLYDGKFGARYATPIGISDYPLTYKYVPRKVNVEEESFITSDLRSRSEGLAKLHASCIRTCLAYGTYDLLHYCTDTYMRVHVASWGSRTSTCC